jgi:hypothetical protein
MACTPLISRHAIPAIFCTTPWATLILPSSVDKGSVVAGLVSLILAAGLDGAAGVAGLDGAAGVGWVIRTQPLFLGSGTAEDAGRTGAGACA